MEARSDINVTSTNSMSIKLFVVFVLIFAITVYICVKLYDTSVVNAEYYRALANDQQLSSFEINANRGTIYDRNGKILAQSKTVWTIVVSPDAIRKNSELYQAKREVMAVSAYNESIGEGLPATAPVPGTIYNEAAEICRALADILGVDYDKLMERIQNSNLQYEEVMRKVEKAEVDAIKEFKKEKGIGVYSVYEVEDTKRTYPGGTLAASVIGFTNYDGDGVYGIEAQYDEYLQGVNGLFVMARDANNQAMPYDYEQRYEAQNGNSLYLTIDEVLQHYLEKNLEVAVSQHKPDNRATGIIMNAKTGAVLAMATYPSFDLNEPSVLSEYDYAKLEEERERKINDTLIINGFAVGTEADLTPEQVEKIDNDITNMRSVLRETQWKNKAISELYFPGSVFKVITMASALEEHAVGVNDGFYCSGSHTVVDTVFHCWDKRGHGQVPNLTMAITRSCNPAFINIGSRLGTAKFTEYFDAFGFTKKSGIDLPGESGSIFLKQEKMGAVELASSSFGQTNKVTPLQMITAYAAAVNGGHLVTPYVVEKIIDDDGNVIHNTEYAVKRQVISEETSALMRGILEEVVNFNGGTNAYIEGYRIGGKSGTSQKIDDPNYSNGNEIYVGSFCAFTPADDPEIIMLVVMDGLTSNGSYYGSAVAAPVVSAVFKETLPYLEIYATQLSEEEIALRDVVVPYLIDSSEHEVVTKLNTMGLNYKFVGLDSGNRVIRTVPAAGQEITKNGTVVVYMAEEDYNMSVVPDVGGMSVAKANEVITNAGLNIKLSGAKHNDISRAFAQSLEPGELVPAGTVIEVDFMYIDNNAG